MTAERERRITADCERRRTSLGLFPATVVDPACGHARVGATTGYDRSGEYVARYTS